MTQTNKLKKAARARAQKTGESYATARRHVAAKLDKKREKSTKNAAAAARAGSSKGSVSEARVIERTEHGFDHWFAILDRAGGVKIGHTALAKVLYAQPTVSSWYAQGITVAYERARGARVKNQLCDGDYALSVRRVLPASFTAAVALLSTKRKRASWLALVEDLGPKIAQAMERKRLTKRDDAAFVRLRIDGSQVELRVSENGERSTIYAAITKLAGPEAVEPARHAWRQALDAFRDTLS